MQWEPNPSSEVNHGTGGTVLEPHTLTFSSPARAGGQELLTVEEAAEILHVGRDKVYYLIRTGQLRSVKIGKLRRISREWIAEFIARLQNP